METVTSQEHRCRTTPGVKASITWTIPNFKNRRNGFESRDIVVTDSYNRVTEWCFGVHPRGRWWTNDAVEYKNFVCVEIRSFNEIPTTVSWEGWILDDANIKHKKMSTPALELEYMNVNSIPNFIKQRELTDRLLPKGTLTLLLEVTVHGKGSKASDNNTLQQRHERLEKLSNDLCQLLAEKELSDIEIHCDEKVFPSHQVVLAARSPVFKAMIQAEMKEKQDKKIVIEDTDPSTVAEMLNFIYTGDISPDGMEEMTKDLLRVADKYQLDDLKEMCEEKLVSNISVENSIEGLVLGDSHNASKLKKIALNLVAKNMKKIVDTDVYKDLLAQRPALTLEITKVILQENE